MPTLTSCLGIHDAPPQLRDELYAKVKAYKKDGFDMRTAMSGAIRDVQKTMKAELDAIHEQVKEQRPDITNQERPRLSESERQIADFAAAQLMIDGRSPDANGVSPLKNIRFDGATPKTVVNQLVKSLPEGVVISFARGEKSIEDAMKSVMKEAVSRKVFMDMQPEKGLTALIKDLEMSGLERYKVPTMEAWRMMDNETRLREIYQFEMLKTLEERKRDVQLKVESDLAVVEAKSKVDSIHAASGGKAINALRDYFMGHATTNERSLVNVMRGVTMENLKGVYKTLAAYESLTGFKIERADTVNILEELNGIKTGDARAAALAKEWAAVTDSMHTRLNQKGIKVGYIDNFVSQSWDTHKTMRAGMSATEFGWSIAKRGAKITFAETKKNWVDAMMADGVLDREAQRYIDPITGGYWDDTKMRTFLEHAWDNISGRTVDPVGSGSKSFADRIGYERQLHFKDSSAWLAMNDAYGSSGLVEAMISQIHKTSKDIGIIEVMGPNPNKTQRELLQHVREKDAENNLAYDMKTNMMEGLWLELTGTRATAGYGYLSSVGSSMRSFLTAVRLAGAFLSQPTDIAVLSAWAAKHNMGAIGSVCDLVKTFNPRNAAHKADADALFLSMTSLVDDIQAAADGTIGQGAMGSFAQFTMKASGMQFWTKSITTSAKVHLIRNLAMIKDKSFDQLEAGMKQMLIRNGFKAKEWDTLRSSPLTDYNGSEVLHPNTIKDQALREQLFGMIESEAHLAVVQPSEWTRAVVSGQMQKGTLPYELTRSMVQFKTFTISMFQNVVPMMFARYSDESRMSQVSKLGYYLGGMLVLGGVSTQLKQLRDGKELKEMNSSEFWGQALAQSMGAGIMGDFLYGNESIFGNQLLVEIAGPAASAVQTTAQTVALAKKYLSEGEPDKAAAETIKLLRDNTIPQYWWGKWALNHILWYPLLEATNPGYTARLERSQASRENNPVTYLEGYGPTEKLLW